MCIPARQGSGDGMEMGWDGMEMGWGSDGSTSQGRDRQSLPSTLGLGHTPRGQQ